jgi:trans-o-hydroxybenzylidenepyruvate hydratase-aldolase
MLSAQDLRGLIATPPTPAKPGADRWDATDTVDLDETARLTEQLIRDGVSAFMVLGTTGECATLTREDYEAYVDCFLATVNKRVPTFVGTTALGTHEIVRRIRFVRERGADATLLGMPMWQPCNLEMAVQHYATISEAFPDFPIMVYANPRAFRYDFPPAFWRQIVERAPTVIAAKFSEVGRLLPVLRASQRRINFVPVSTAVYAFARLSPETTTTCWATSVAMGPQPSIALMDAILAGDWERAKQVNDDIAWASEPSHAYTSDQQIFASYNIQSHRYEQETAGYCPTYPIRPPYNYMPDEYIKLAHETGRRWAQIREKYATARLAARS